MTFSTVAPSPYSIVKPGMKAGTVHRCITCGAEMKIPADNELPPGWQLYHAAGRFMACCPEHPRSVMELGLHKDLYHG